MKFELRIDIKKTKMLQISVVFPMMFPIYLFILQIIYLNTVQYFEQKTKCSLRFDSRTYEKDIVNSLRILYWDTDRLYSKIRCKIGKAGTNGNHC